MITTCFFLFLALFGCTQSKPPLTPVVRLNLNTEPPTLDARKATDATSANVLLMLFEGLTRISFDHTPHPAVAESIEISEDKKTYIFRLRECLWSSGEAITSEDFRYAWESILDPKFPSYFAYKLYVIQNAKAIKEGKMPIEKLGVETPDSKTLIVHLANPTPYFLELVAFPTFFPVSRNIDLKRPDWATASQSYVSNGPFKMKKWEHDDEIVVEKNQLYWDKDQVHLDAIHLLMVGDTTTEFYMFERDELDWAGSPLSNLPPDFLIALEAENRVNRSEATGSYYYKINTNQFPLNNKNIRKALALAIDRNAITHHIAQGGQKAALGIVPPMRGLEGPHPLFVDHDIDQSQKLFKKGLDELGLSLSSFPRLRLSFNTNREHQKIAEAIQHQWKEGLGIETELENYDWKVYLSKIEKQDYQIARTAWISDFHDPISFLEPFKYKDDENNATGWEHPAYIALLEAAAKETALQKRNEYLCEAEKLLIDEMPIIPIYYICFNYMKKPYIKNVYLSPLGFIDFKEAYIE